VAAVMGPPPGNTGGDTAFSPGQFGIEQDFELFRGDISQQAGTAASVNGAVTPVQAGVTTNLKQLQSVEAGPAAGYGFATEVSQTATFSVRDGLSTGSSQPLPPLTGCLAKVVCGTFDDTPGR
jgi:hypothetical protein